MLIRAATHDDLTPLGELAIQTYAAAFGASMSPADVAAHLAASLAPSQIARMLQCDTVLVAESAEQLVGFVQFGRAKDGPAAAANPDQELRRLYVAAAFQNQGIGTRLLQTALAHPTMWAAERIVLDVWEHNPGARRLYERHGFVVVGEQVFEVASGAPTSRDLLMVRHAPGA